MTTIDLRCPKCDRPVAKGSAPKLPKIKNCPRCKVALKPVKSSEIGIGTILYFDFVNHLHTVK